MVKIELEVDSLEQLEEALALGVDAVLLDNMPPPVLRARSRWWTGAPSPRPPGGSRRQTAPEIAATGVDLISIGWLTHSATVLDIGLDYRDT